MLFSKKEVLEKWWSLLQDNAHVMIDGPVGIGGAPLEHALCCPQVTAVHFQCLNLSVRRTWHCHYPMQDVWKCPVVKHCKMCVVYEELYFRSSDNE
jgi:hypothetical protein